MTTRTNAEQQFSGNPPPLKSRIAVFVLIDALGWRYVQNRTFLADLLPFRRSLRTVLGFSSGAIPTILTGVVPSEHGHWNLFYYDPQNSPFRWLRHFRFLPDAVLDTRVSRKLIKELGKRVFGLGPLFECCVSPRLMPYFNWVEKRNIYERSGIAGADSIFDRLSQLGVPYRVYTYHHSGDEEILRGAVRDLQSGEGRFFFLYLSEMDGFLHMHCSEPAEIENRLQWYESRLRAVFQAAAGLDPEATFAIFSDHGMTPVRHHYDVVAEIVKLGLTMPDDYLAVYDSTMARFWFFSERALDKVRECLAGIPCGHILSEEELRNLGILFADKRYGQLIFLMAPGWLMARSDFQGQWMPVGMHGYHPDDEYSDAVFLSNRQPEYVMTIQDVYRFMEEAVR